MAALSSFFEQMLAALASYRPVQDTLDILLVTLIIYEMIKLIRKTRSVQIFKGLFIMFVVYIAVLIFDMPVMKSVFETIFASALVIIVILFTPEIRNVLEKMGRNSVFKMFTQKHYSTLSSANAVNCVCSACSEMSDDKIGALIVFERKSMLGEIMKTGTTIDAEVSPSLIRNVFYPKSPLHDGALIISGGRVASAGCILPLTNTTNLNAKFGTRHRAAVGITEQSDAVVAVVSEETGAISFVHRGYIEHDVTPSELRELLLNALDMGQSQNKKGIFSSIKAKKGGKKDE
ncbi:MAG: diadenylate cyclase CdaA [Clostridia bacterium]|nr:diadenylate cyclase CdaA [Clostridia bacterium]